MIDSNIRIDRELFLADGHQPTVQEVALYSIFLHAWENAPRRDIPLVPLTIDNLNRGIFGRLLFTPPSEDTPAIYSGLTYDQRKVVIIPSLTPDRPQLAIFETVVPKGDEPVRLMFEHPVSETKVASGLFVQHPLAVGLLVEHIHKPSP